MEVLLRAEALDAAQHSRTGEPALTQPFDDRLVERLAVPMVALAEIEADQQASSVELHQIALPRETPATTATTPTTIEPMRLAEA